MMRGRTVKVEHIANKSSEESKRQRGNQETRGRDGVAQWETVMGGRKKIDC